jgi:hypothetical protein
MLRVGDPAAPRTSRAHEHSIPQSIGPHLNVCCDLCYPCAFISHVWSPFHGCQSQPGIHRFRSRFHEPKPSHAHKQMLWRRWFHLDAVNTSVWPASMFLWLYLRTPGFQGRILCARNIVPMASEDSEPSFCDIVFASPGQRIPTDSEHGMRFRRSSREFQAPNHRLRPS